jgi:ankyrin repeat protein
MVSAARTGQIDVTELLLEKGFDINMTVVNGISALDIAALFSHENVIIFLLEKGANPGIYSDHLRHSAQYVGEKDHDRIVGLLNGTIPLSSRNREPEREGFVDTVSLAWALSFIATIAYKRTTIANPNPGGFPARCHVCQDLDFRRGVPKDVEVVHWVFEGLLAEAASRGCPGCEMIRQCLQHLASVYGESLAAWRTATELCQLLSTVHGGPLYVACGDGLASQPTVRAEIYSQSGMPSSKQRNPDCWIRVMLLITQ